MLSKEQNERLTRVGPGTPCGELLRRYWHAVCPSAEITADKPKKRVRIMGEDLLVLRAPDGRVTCVEERCPHRRASLYLGFLEPDGIRCCYHGWKFDFGGQCVEQPFEPKKFCNRVRLRSYPVQKLGGILFVYMGPDPTKAPPLPRWDVLVRCDRPRVINVFPDHNCNWMQIQENTADSVHTYYTHGHMSAVLDLPAQYMGGYFYRPILEYDWKVCEWGIEKTLVYGGDKPEIEIRPPLIFPTLLRIPEGPIEAMHFRVPIDDDRTRIIWVGLLPETAPVPKPESENADVPVRYAAENSLGNGEYDLSDFYGQDRAVWETMGVTADRWRETLGASDRGVVMYRRMLAEQIDRVERGEEPTVGVVRDADKNRIIEFLSASKPWRDTRFKPSEKDLHALGE
jgi:5,5'-dehydrodivanillate O-demethylase